MMATPSTVAASPSSAVSRSSSAARFVRSFSRLVSASTVDWTRPSIARIVVASSAGSARKARNAASRPLLSRMSAVRCRAASLILTWYSRLGSRRFSSALSAVIRFSLASASGTSKIAAR
jgi:hypothetical protein